jgi:hypothetical protein
MADLTELITRMREDHIQRWHSVSAEVWGETGFCPSCRVTWPCDVIVLIEVVEENEAAMPAECRKWLNPELD